MKASHKRQVVKSYLMTRQKEDLIVLIIYPYYKKTLNELYKEAIAYFNHQVGSDPAQHSW